MFVIGSFAANFHKPDIWSKYSDLDLVSSWEDFQRMTKSLDIQSVPIGLKKMASKKDDLMIETEIVWENSSGYDFLLLCKDFEIISWNGLELKIPNLDWLYAFKISHRYLKNSPFFDKTRQDILKFKDLECKIPNLSWLKKREKETYNYKHPSLSQNKDKFFSGDMVEYVYDHDSLHEAMKHLERPAYTYYQKDGAEVDCDRQKWENLPHKYKLFGVLEESYVLALERSQIPYPSTDPNLSFKIALEKVCTSITSGWFRSFAYDHYDEIMELYNNDYIYKFQKGLESGIIRRI